MLKDPVVEETINILENNDYSTCRYHGCFDVAARKNELLLLKVLQNVDAFQIDQARNLRIISNNLDAHPMVLGIGTRREKLKKGIVYERFELPTVSIETFRSMIEDGIFPRFYRDRGGLYVEIDSDVLKEMRRKKGLTQRELAESVGINKKVIYEHEKKQLRMFLEIAERIEKMLDTNIIKEANVFKTRKDEHGLPTDKLEVLVGRDLKKLGFQVEFVKQAPFDVFAKEKVLLISDIEENRRKIVRRVVDLRNFINLVKKPALVITESGKEEDVLGIPVIERKELAELEKGKELIKIVKRKSK